MCVEGLVPFSKMASLAEQIKNLSRPEPTNFDPEEDDFDITRAKLVEKDKDYDLDDQDNDSSALRKKNISLLSDEDRKYHGRRVSRMDVAKMRGDFMDSDESVDELECGDDSDQESPEESTVLENQKDEEGHQEKDTDDGDDDNHDQDSVYSDDDNEKDDDGNEEDDDEEDDDENEDDDEDGDVLSSRHGDNEEQDTGINSFSASKVGEEIEKGAAVKHQLNLWDTFLEYRIRLQKTMVLANKLPQCDISDEFMNTSNGNQKPETLQGKKALSDLLYKLLIIQEKLLDQNPETRKALYPGLKTGNNNKESDDEEIPSDSENENEDEKDEEEDEKTGTDKEHSLKLPLKRKAGFTREEFCECITKRHAAFQDVRDSVISKWSEKTRLASGTLSSKSFSAFDKSALTQIKQVLNDKPRLIKRTQLKRSSYRVLGKCEKEKQSVNPEPEEEADVHLKDYDTEIFDDDDFYHQLLRELIERRTTTNSDDPIEMGRQWLELQKLRRKIKKKVDTKASKGRKLRYNVHGKLASYMPPIDRGSMPDSSRNELFSSVFGQSKVKSEACDIDVFR